MPNNKSETNTQPRETVKELETERVLLEARRVLLEKLSELFRGRECILGYTQAISVHI
jgi:hypothetical protein